MTRVLYLTHHLPWPPHCGGRLREAQILERLAETFAIDLVAVTEDYARDQGALGAVPAGIQASVFRAHRAWRPHRGPYTRRYSSADARTHLDEVVRRGRHDVVHVEGHFLIDLLPREARRRAVLVEHNVESTLHEQRAKSARTLLGRLTEHVHAALTKRDEISAWTQVAGLGAVTERDAELMRQRLPGAPAQVTPNGFDHLGSTSTGTLDPTSSPVMSFDLVMVGNYGYQPSEDAAVRLLTEIWPLVSEQLPGVNLALVGNNPSSRMQEIAAESERVLVSGRVARVDEWLDSAKVFVAPLSVGGGVKVKVVEALARGRAVVTTSVGAQGLERLPENAIAIADTDADLAAACVHLLRDDRNRHAQAERGQKAVATMPTWDDAAERLAACWMATVQPRVAVQSGTQ